MKGSFGVTLAAVALAAVLGFFVGRRSSGDAESGARGGGSARGGFTPPGKTGRAVGGAGRRDGGPAAGRYRGASPQSAIRRVVSELELSTMGNMDFDAMFDVYDAIRWMNAEEAGAALAELNEMEASHQIKSMLQMMLINHWSKEDGQRVVEFGLEQSQPNLRSMAIMGGLRGWAREDPETAYAWFKDNRDKMTGGAAGGYMHGVFLGSMAQHDMDSAFMHLGKLNATNRKQALNAIAGQVARDPFKRDEFLKKLDGYEDREARDDATQRLVSTMAWQDPHEARAFVEGREFDAGMKEKMMDHVARSWANSEPEAALTWRIGSAEGKESGKMVSQVYGRWLTQDPKEAEAWLAKQPGEVRSDELYRTASERLTRNNNYEKAVDYAGKIASEEIRTARMRDLYANWKGNDEAKARKWLEGLDEPTRTAIERKDEAEGDEGALP